jgi:phosphohistidine phosphatase
MIALVHHGEALEPAADPARPLSPRGRQQAAALAQQAAARGLKPDAIWHSGKLRARQTAEAFWRACNPLSALSAARGLQPDDPPEWMRDRLAGETRTILVVGHMPHLRRLRHVLVGGGSVDEGDFPLHGCVVLEARGDGWKEVWRLEP